MNLQADTLLAITGILPKEITERDHLASQTVTVTWQRRLKSFLLGKQKRFDHKPVPRDLEKLFLRMAEPLNPLEVETWLEGVGIEDPDLVTSYFTSITLARQHIVEIWPKFSIETLAGPKLLPLSIDDAMEVASVFQVLDDPDRVLDAMEQWHISQSEALAFRKVYPALYDFAAAELQNLMAERLVKDQDWDPGWQKEAVIATFKGLPPEVMFVPPKPPPPPEEKLELRPELKATQAQLAEAPVGRENSGGSL